MSSLVIGLDIGDSHITASLVRIDQSSDENLSIERDIFYIRSIENNIEKNPRAIISIWIDCVHDVLEDFVNNYQEDDTIIGIACGIFCPMDYERGISHIQTSKSNKYDQFFGLNLRLLFQYGLRDLISRWKYDYYAKYYTPPTSPRSSISYPKSQNHYENVKQTRSTTIKYISNLIEPFTTNEEIQETKLSIKNLTDYCGLHDTGIYSNNNDDVTNSRNETISSITSKTIDSFSPKLWSIIEQLSDIPISFYNDTTCFAVGEANNIYHKDYKRILALTLGTSFGSTFIDQGKIILNRSDVPEDGMLWNCSYDENSIADDWFSTRGLINIYKKIAEQNFSITKKFDHLDSYTLIQQASNGDQNAIKAFRIFAQLLGNFLIPYIKAFHTHLIVIGGGIAHAWYLFEDELNDTLKNFCQIQVYFSLSHEKSICLGAVQQQLSNGILVQSKGKRLRQTSQNLLPVIKTIPTNHYDLYPCHEIPIGYIGIGHKELNEKLIRLIKENEILLIDGFVGTYFDEFAYQLNKSHQQIKTKTSPSLTFYDTRIFLQVDTKHKQEYYLQSSKSIFGKLANDLDFKKDFIDLNKLNYLQKNLSYPCVIIGPGASFINEISPLIYIDLTKNELYYRIAAKTACSYLKPLQNIQEDISFRSNDDEHQLTSTMYEQKCLYFLDYPIFNKLKQELLPRINFFIDGQRPNCPTWLDGNTFRQALAHIVTEPIRVRPWFEPGPWGGQWLKSVCSNLSQYPKNYAWSFEMVTPENGILLSDRNHHLVELSWDIFYGSQANRILGNDIHCRLFNGSNDFPIRFDFLDTIDGGNLSLQCHPNSEYIRTNFGEKIPQDETYYIIETKQHWKEETDNESSACVYLGFQENIHPEEFYQALLTSRNNQEKLNVEQFIQCLPSNIHDFFLIPNETIHASGQNQVVLEISATPYTYTFKLYDWLRLGLDGHLRPLNIEHGMKNLKFNRRGEQLRCQPISMKIEENQYEEQHLPTHDLHFYDVERLIIEPNESIEINRLTENRFHLCMLVEGDAIEIQFNSIDNNQQKQIRQYNYIETFLIPATIKEYRLRPIIKNKEKKTKPQKSILIIAFLKWDCEKLLE